MTRAQAETAVAVSEEVLVKLWKPEAVSAPSRYKGAEKEALRRQGSATKTLQLKRGLLSSSECIVEVCHPDMWLHTFDRLNRGNGPILTNLVLRSNLYTLERAENVYQHVVGSAICKTAE